MKTAAAIFGLSLIFMPNRGSTMESIGTYDEVANIHGEHIKIVQATEPEFPKQNLDIQR
jgi:hypothetical protein